MDSTYKNIILKRLKYFITGFFLITILPGNAGVKDHGSYMGSSPDSLYSGNAYSVFITDNESILKTGPGDPDIVKNEDLNALSDSANHYVYNAREISPTGRSFNFLLSVQ